MIPILYSKDETDFTHHGHGYLVDAISTTVTEERNGAYELTMQYPLTGKLFSLIAEGELIKAKVDATSAYQLFRIYKSSKPLKGVVTFNAEHISYDLNGLPLAGYAVSNATPAVAINKALSETPLNHPFSVQSSIATQHSTTIKTPCSVRGLLGGQEGSILDVWGGEYEFDNYTIKLHASRGADNGVSIEYGKNLTDVKQEINISEIYTHIMPYAVYNRDDGNGHTEEVYVFLTEKTIALTNAPSLGHERAYIHDFSGDVPENTVPTETWLRNITNSYIASHDLVTPKININVSFINLADTLDYKNIAPLERVKLCDIISVRFSKLGITAKAKIVKTVYNVLKEKYDSLVVGDAKSNFADTVNKQNAEITHITTRMDENKSEVALAIERAIATATAAITGQSGGYVVLNPSEHPQEILILDAASGGVIENAVNVWRWNSAGLGHSSSGYNGTYTTAITADGKIVADFIATGELDGALLKADSVSATAITAQTIQTKWNGISKYIQFEAGELNVYDSDSAATQKLRQKLNDSGSHFYRDNYYVGKIGTNQWSGNSAHKGLVFDLDYQGMYMAFAQKASSAASEYTTMLCFSRDNSIFTEYGMHLGCDLHGHYYTLKNVYFDDVNVVYKNANNNGFTGEIPIVTNITPRPDGGVDWVTSKVRVSNGIIVGYWYYEIPLFVSASTASATTINVVFNEFIDSSSVVSNDFTVKVNGASRTISSAALKSDNNRIVVLTLASPALSASDSITVAYTKGSLKSTDGGYTSSFSAKSVNNTL
jgi:phage minor structural protein